jgi:heme a synthase
MTSAPSTAPEPVAPALPASTVVRTWLYVIALMIVAMIVVGGATRLTESGLSITEWRPILGAIPPLNEAEWQEELAKYREIPQYELVNKGMTLSEFKTIYWWEWAHRFLGRAIGVAFLLPLVFFWATGRIERRLKAPLVGLFILGGLQGAVGWWMVASGLVDRTDVSQYRLAIHLTLACAILAYTVWLARGLSPLPRQAQGGTWLRLVAALLLALVFLQIFLGGLVAGLNAGLSFNTWPLMDGAIVPAGLLAQDPAWRNLFENVLTVQFNHRMVGYLLLAIAILHAAQARGTAHGRSAALVAAIVAVQAALGIATLVMVVPLHVALSHQLGAVAVLWAATTHLYGVTRGATPQGHVSGQSPSQVSASG